MTKKKHKMPMLTSFPELWVQVMPGNKWHLVASTWLWVRPSCGRWVPSDVRGVLFKYTRSPAKLDRCLKCQRIG